MFILVILLVMLSFVPFTKSQSNNSFPAIKVHRDAELFGNGILHIEDSLDFTVQNGEVVQVSSIFLGFNNEYSDVRHEFKIFRNGQGIASEVHLIEINEFSGYELRFPSTIALSDKDSLEIKASYDFINLNKWLGANYSISIPVYPVMKAEIEQISFSFTLPKELELESLVSSIQLVNSTDNGKLLIQHEANNIDPFKEESIDVVYTLPENAYVAICEILDYEIQVKSSNLLIIETVRIKNLGSPLFDFVLPVTDGATNIQAKDKVGPLDIEFNSSDSNLLASISPRLPLFNGSKWEFTVFYSVDEGLYVKRNNNRELEFLTPGFPLYVDNLQVKILLTKNSKIFDFTENAVIIEDDSGIYSINHYENVLPGEQKTVNLNYELGSVTTLGVPILLLLGLVIVIGAVYYMRVKPRKYEAEQNGRTHLDPQVVEVEKKEEKGVEALISLYNERLRLLKELIQVDTGLFEGRMGQRDYEQRTAEIFKLNSKLLDSLTQIKASVKIKDEEMEKNIKNLDRVESSLSKLENDLRNLENRYNAGRISRRNYFERRKRLTQRRRDILAQMETSLKTLN